MLLGNLAGEGNGERRREDKPYVVDIDVKRSGSGITSFVLVLGAIAFVVAAVMRLVGFDGTRHMIATVALTPYIAVAGLVWGGIAFFARRWVVAIVVTLIAVVLVANVATRAFPDSRPNGVGTEVRVMTSNTLAGTADAQKIMDVVREKNADVLALQELTPEMVRDLQRAGLDRALPNQVFLAEPGVKGSGIAARWPVQARQLTPPSTLKMAGALVDLPGTDIEIVSVHPLPPVVPVGPEPWRRELAGLPPRQINGPVRVLAGDFNATLDHVALRRLINAGYEDAADQVGAGLIPTWPSGSNFLPPPVTLDHVLVDARCPVDTVDVVDIPGTDHRAVVTQFVVPQ